MNGDLCWPAVLTLILNLGHSDPCAVGEGGHNDEIIMCL